MKTERKKVFRPSILDRLLDNEPESLAEPEKSHYQQMRDLHESVRRDLQNLLNTRYRILAPGVEFSQLENSLLNYGLPDLATVNIADVEQKRNFTRLLEKILRNYEPRFKAVKVIVLENKDASDKTLKFRIDATLYADPAPETVIFDSALDPVSRTVNVEELRHG